MMDKLSKVFLLLMGLLIFFSGSPSYASGDSLPVMTITKTKVPPVIDGKMEPVEWKYATAATGFVDLGGTLTKDDTIVYLTYDDKNLYLAFRSTISGKIKAKVTKHDGAVYNDDAIEIRLAPDPARPQHFYAFIGNSLGTIYDSIGHSSPWDGDWKFKNKVVDSGETVGGILTFARKIWTAEISIPFKDLGISTPKEGALWRVNFHRDWNTETREAGEGGKNIARWTSWSPPVGGFNNPKGFGYLYFREQAPAIKVESLGDPIGGDIDIKGKVSNFSPRTFHIKAHLSVSLAKLKKEIIKKEVPLTLTPYQEKPLEIKKTLELTKSLPLDLLFTVTDSSKKETLYRNAFTFTSRPSFRLDAALLYSRKEMLITWDIKRLPKLPPAAFALAEVYTTKDNILITSFPLKELNNKHRTGTYSLNISKFTPGDYVVKVYLKDKGKIIAQTNADFIIPKKPVWWGNKLGISDKVPPPWSPVKVKGKTVSVWGREYEFTNLPFPSQIINQGKPQLSSPINLEIVTDKGAIRWKNSRLQYVSKTDTKVIFKTINRSPLIDLSGKVAIEFDGFMRIDFTLSPKAPIVIKSLVLEIPLKGEDALYMKALKLFPKPNYASYSAALYKGAEGGIFNINKTWFFSSNGWVWPDEFMHYVWVLGDKRGLSVTFNSDKNFYTKKYVEILNKGKTKELRFNFIGFPYSLKKPLSYTLALEATPIKPLPKNPKKWHYGYSSGEKPEGQVIMYAVAQYGSTPIGWPELTVQAKRRIKAYREEGVRMFPAYDANLTTVEMPEFQLFGKEWEAIPRYGISYNFNHRKFRAVWASLKSSYGDFFLWGLNKMLDEGIGGIYLDSPGVLASTNEYSGCGYIDKEGKRRVTIGLFATREIYKRMYTLFKSRDPGSFIFHHAVPISPLASFVDGTTEGEMWGARAGFSNLTADRFRYGFGMYQQYGIPYQFYAAALSYYPAPELRTPAEEVIPISLIHNIYPLNWGIVENLKPIWEIMDEWYTSSEWIPYWKSSSLVKSFGKDVKVSIYRKEAEKKSLLLVANLGKDKTEGELTINLSNFGLKKDRARLIKINPAKFKWNRKKPKQIEPITKKEVPLTDSKITVSLPKYSLQFFLLEER